MEIIDSIAFVDRRVRASVGDMPSRSTVSVSSMPSRRLAAALCRVPEAGGRVTCRDRQPGMIAAMALRLLYLIFSRLLDSAG